MNLTYGVFKGDFLPYEEKFPEWEDFWTGYYSTRLHMKRMIRHVFNDIQSTKLLLAIRATSHNKNKIKFNGPTSFKIDGVTEKLFEAEKWAIMMHHDAITGTHTNHTEPSYYKLLKESLNYLDTARRKMDNFLTNEIPDHTVQSLNSIVEKLSNPEIVHHTIVNPSGYYRIQIMNVTVPEKGNDDAYVLYVQSKDSVSPITKAEYADIYELSKVSKRPQKVRKIFFIVSMDALSDQQVYIIRSSNKGDCKKPGITCASQAKQEQVKGRVQLSNSDVTINLNSHGDLQSFRNSRDNSTEEFTEHITYHDTIRKTRSGLYLYNPRNNKTEVNFKNTEIYSFKVKNLVDIVQVYKYNNNERVLKTYIINQNGCPNLRKQFFMEFEIDSDRVAEFSFTLRKIYKSASSTHKAYADDSMKMVERPILDPRSKIPHTNVNELEGYYTSPCVHGGLLRETYKKLTNQSYESFFGWANSNPIGCTFSANNEVSFVVFRSIGQSDYKGVNDRFKDNHVVSTSFQFYISSSIERAMFHKVRANAKINEPFAVFSKVITPNDFVRLPISSNLLSGFLNFNNGSVQLSREFGEVKILS